jgi:hypothetical protein
LPHRSAHLCPARRVSAAPSLASQYGFA